MPDCQRCKQLEQEKKVLATHLQEWKVWAGEYENKFIRARYAVEKIEGIARRAREKADE